MKGTNNLSRLSHLAIAAIAIGTFIGSILVCLVVTFLIRRVRSRAVIEESFVFELGGEEPYAI
jgi:hypothetical protein